jgi:D-3-phosphoglycerate dehydrogenase
MKKGAKLINTSRGELVDENAVVDALKSGHLSGVGFDTFEKEPYKGPLTTFPQVVLTSHMGSYAMEARAQMEKEAVENLLKGLRVKGLVE